ncbi:TRAP transporter small permease subunit [Dehalococcoidia bacterium]|nr:TRAP transporter small permease subunit [Dehalococcoidia bacterium]
MLRATGLRIVRGGYGGMLGIQKSILIVVFATVAGGLLTQVVARYVFESPIFAADSFIGYTAVWLYFIGAAHGTFERTHIKAEFITMIIKNQQTLTVIKAVVAGISFFVACVMSQWSYEYVRWSIRVGETTAAYGVPFVYFQSALLAGSILMAVYFLMELVDHTRQAYRHHRYHSPSN